MPRQTNENKLTHWITSEHIANHRKAMETNDKQEFHSKTNENKGQTSKH